MSFLEDPALSVEVSTGDIDKDGVDEIFSQFVNNTSDFPGITYVLKLVNDQLAVQYRILNHDNHHDSPSLEDVDGDGLPDYMQIGVDKKSAGIIKGVMLKSLKDEQTLFTEGVGQFGGFGVQCLKLQKRFFL